MRSGPVPVRPPDMMSKPFIATDMTISHWKIGMNTAVQ
jgi:hypothetical protein